MVTSKANGLGGRVGPALACAMALCLGCASGEDVVGGSGSSGGGRGGSGGYGGYIPPGVGGSTYVPPGAGGATSTGGFGGIGGSLVGFGGSVGLGGSTYIPPIGGGGGGGGSGGASAVDSAAGGSAGGAGCGRAGNEVSPVTDQGMSLKYRNQDGGARGTAIQFDLEISTSLAAGVALRDMEIRYYFTNEVGDPLVTEMYWAGTSTDAVTSAVTAAVVPMAAVPGANTYASYTFPSSAVKLVSGNPLVIKPALHKAGYSASFNQCDDYSYDVNRDFAVSTRIAILVGGTLAWGSVPQAGIDASTEGGAGDAPTEAGAGDAPTEAGAADAPNEMEVADAPTE